MGKEKGYEGKTSTDNNHDHSYTVNGMGNGIALINQSQEPSLWHAHIIKNWKVLDQNKHLHIIDPPVGVAVN